MKRFFYRFRLSLLHCCLLWLLPLAAHAKPTGEIIFRHPADFRELWIADVNEAHNARQIFREDIGFFELSIQKDNRYAVAVGERFIEDELHLSIDAYLLDRKRLHAEAKNLTRGLFGEILDAAISRNGEVVFTNLSSKEKADRVRGIYLIPNRELKNPFPNAQLLKPVDAHYVDWSPNGKEIAYSTDKGIFLFHILTQKVSQITKNGYHPVFSPDGKQIAFLTGTKPTNIGILSLTHPQNLQHIELETTPRYLTWTPNGQYLIYTAPGRNNSRNFAVPIAGGPPEAFLDMVPGGVPLFDWTHTSPFAVEPTNKRITVWARLKQQDF